MPNHLPQSNLRLWAGAATIIVAALLYLLTLDNGLRPDELTGGDLITHQYAQVEARPSNAPGYPLYTMGGWLWFRLGRGLLGWAFNPLQILSLYSTLWGLAALLLLYLILLRVSRRWGLAALLTLFQATTFFFWYYSVTTEQYTSAVFQTLLIIWLAFTWDDVPRDRLLLGLAFVSGTMLANMVTTLFILPPLLWFIFFRRAETAPARLMLLHYLRRPRLAIAAIGAALLPLLSYAYIYIRGAQHPEWRGAGQWPSPWAWFLQFITIQQGRDELGPGLAAQSFFTAEFPALIWQELTWPIFLGGLFGLIYLGRRRAIFLGGTLLIYFVFAWGYRFGNWFQVIMPTYPIFVIGFAAGITRVIELAERRSLVSGHWSLVIRWGSAFLLLGLLAWRFSASLPEANQRDRPTDTGLNPGWALLADRPATPALIFTDFEEQVALQYLKGVWGLAPEIAAVAPGQPPAQPVVDHAALVLTYASRRAVAAAPETITAAVHPQAAGEQLIALWPVPRTELPPGVKPLALKFGDQLELVGWERVSTGDTLPPMVAPRWPLATWQIALYWQASTQLPENYTVSVRPLVEGQLINVAGENLIQDHQPVWGVYPTSRWQPGEIVRDVYALRLPEGVNPEAMQVVVYRTGAGGFENLADYVIPLSNP